MVVFSYYPSDPRVRREAEVLERAGMEVDVICLRGKKESGVENFGGVTAYRVMEGTERKENVIKYFLLSFVFMILAFIRLLGLSAKKKYRLVQAHNMPDLLVFAGAFHKAMGVPLVLDLHDLSVELFESKCGGTWLAGLKPLVRLMEKASCAFADRLLTTSAGFKESLVKRGVDPKKITLILNSADDNVFNHPPKRDLAKIKKGPVLLYHGTVAKRFGLHVAIDAVNRVRETLPGARLFIYGKYDPSYRDELERIVRSEGLEGIVTLGGYLPLEKVTETIGGSDIGVVPYLSDPFMNLALSTKIFEYVSMRMPVVASRLDSITSVFDGKSIEYFEPGNADDLAVKLVRVCRAPASRKGYIERAARAYESMSWPVMSKRYLDEINGLISKIRISA